MFACSSNLKKPKKCLSAYMIFVKESRPNIVIQYPQLSSFEIMKKVGEMWQKLLQSPEGTKYFQDKANKDKIRYLQEQKDFYDEVGRIKGKETEQLNVKID